MGTDTNGLLPVDSAIVSVVVVVVGDDGGLPAVENSLIAVKRPLSTDAVLWLLLLLLFTFVLVADTDVADDDDDAYDDDERYDVDVN